MFVHFWWDSVLFTVCLSNMNLFLMPLNLAARVKQMSHLHRIWYFSYGVKYNFLHRAIYALSWLEFKSFFYSKRFSSAFISGCCSLHISPTGACGLTLILISFLNVFFMDLWMASAGLFFFFFFVANIFQCIGLVCKYSFVYISLLCSVQGSVYHVFT